MDGTAFLVAGYLVTWLALGWYVWRLERRTREARRSLERGGAIPEASEIGS